MKVNLVLGAVCVSFLFAAATSRAATLSSFPFTGSSPVSVDTDPTSTTSPITFDTGLTDTTRYTATGNPGAALRINTDETDGTSFPTANLANDDFTFSITPAAGSKLVLDTLSFDLDVNNAAIVSNVRVQLSGTGTGFTTLGTISDFSTTTFTAESFDLSPANTALAAGVPIYVRFLIYDNANNANGFTGFDNITVTGVTATLVPEPGTNALLALGVLAMVGSIVRRQRRLAA